jgi:hypothetical protein
MSTPFLVFLLILGLGVSAYLGISVAKFVHRVNTHVSQPCK